MHPSAKPQPCCARFLHTFACSCSFYTEVFCPAKHPISAGLHTIQPQSSLACPRCVFNGLLSDVRNIQLSVRALRTSTSLHTHNAIARMSSLIPILRHPVLEPDDAHPDLQGPLPAHSANPTATWPERTTSAALASAMAKTDGDVDDGDADDMHTGSAGQHYGLVKVILLYSTVADRFRRAYAMYFPNVPATRYSRYTSTPNYLAEVLERIVRVLDEQVGYTVGKDVAGQESPVVVQCLDPLFVVVRDGGADDGAWPVADETTDDSDDEVYSSG